MPKMEKDYNRNTKLLTEKNKSLNLNNLQTICRTCLKVLQSTSVSTRKGSDNYDIREAPELKELLKTLALLNISDDLDDVYPQRLCTKCYHTLNEFQYFRDMVQQSSEWLRKIVEHDAMEVEIEKEADVIKVEKKTDAPIVAIKVEKETDVAIKVERDTDAPTMAIKVEKETETDALFKIETCDGDGHLEETRSDIFKSRLMSEADKSNDIELESEAEYIRRINNCLTIKVENAILGDTAVSFENDQDLYPADSRMVNAFKDEIDVQPSTSKEAGAKRKLNAADLSAAKCKCSMEGCRAGFTTKHSLNVHNRNVHTLENTTSHLNLETECPSILLLCNQDEQEARDDHQQFVVQVHVHQQDLHLLSKAPSTSEQLVTKNEKHVQTPAERARAYRERKNCSKNTSNNHSKTAKTPAERNRAYRERKKSLNNATKNHLKIAKTSAERMRDYRERKKLLKNLTNKQLMIDTFISHVDNMVAHEGVCREIIEVGTSTARMQPRGVQKRPHEHVIKQPSAAESSNSMIYNDSRDKLWKISP